MKKTNISRRASWLALIASGGLLTAFPTVAFSAVTSYNNTNTFSGSSVINSGTALIGGTEVTRMVADDITFAPGSTGMSINDLTFSAVNDGSSATAARVRIGLWADDGAGGGPGTYLLSSAIPVTLAGDSLSLISLLALDVPVPADGKLWAGEWFDNYGTRSTSTELDALGVGLFDPPTVGSSIDEIFATGGPGFVDGNNPAGSLVSFGGSPVANLGFTFNAVPEPGSIALGALGGLALLQARRSRKA